MKLSSSGQCVCINIHALLPGVVENLRKMAMIHSWSNSLDMCLHFTSLTTGSSSRLVGTPTLHSGFESWHENSLS